MENIREFAKAVNNSVRETGEHKRFYLTQWGFDDKEECYFIDEGHHGFLNGGLILKDGILKVYTMMHELWEIFKHINKVAGENDITVVMNPKEEIK